jgi:hypothetical protein
MTLIPLACPFCGCIPHTTNNQYLSRGSNWARVECLNDWCVANPCVAAHQADCPVGTPYLVHAINKWNAAIQRNRGSL